MLLKIDKNWNFSSLELSKVTILAIFKLEKSQKNPRIFFQNQNLTIITKPFWQMWLQKYLAEWRCSESPALHAYSFNVGWFIEILVFFFYHFLPELWLFFYRICCIFKAEVDFEFAMDQELIIFRRLKLTLVIRTFKNIYLVNFWGVEIHQTLDFLTLKIGHKSKKWAFILNIYLESADNFDCLE